jgi:hypothetical protein
VWGSVPGGDSYFCLRHRGHIGVGAWPQHPIKWILGGPFSQGVKWSECEADHSPLTTIQYRGCESVQLVLFLLPDAVHNDNCYTGLSVRTDQVAVVNFSFCIQEVFSSNTGVLRATLRFFVVEILPYT